MVTTVDRIREKFERRRASLVWLCLAVGVGLVVAAAGSATAATLHVANNGVDAAGCGLAAHPCRSITRALVHANGGDLIEVGPGRYGDLDRDGALGGPGEEAPPAACGCMVHIGKRVSVRSRDGALVTVIDARWPFQSIPGSYGGAVVRIDADGAVFGDPGNGFTVIGDQVGVQVSAGTSEVYLGGNLAVANGSVGFAVGGNSHVLDSNVAIANQGGGFFVASRGTLLFHNLASVNRSSGFFLQGSGFVVRGNQATANGDVGFAILPPPPPTEVPPGTTPPVVAARLLDNAARGNRSAGIRLWAPITMERTTLYGNGDAPQFVPANCGLVNESGAAVDASRTYWGAATGPGADPADKAGPGSGCDIGAGSVTIVVPFAGHAFSHPNDGIK